jgi:D-3-phosphoglycerate dehydrogenase / 2-oxoglutarate reductase
MVLAALSGKPPTSITVEARGELSTEDLSVLPLAAMRGVFSGLVDDQVTFVNAPRLAAVLGVEVDLVQESESAAYRSQVTLRAIYPDGETLTIGGTLSGLHQVEKLVEVNGQHFDIRAEGHALLLEYLDRPGVMGRVGTLLGEAGINVLAAQLNQAANGEEAVMVLRVDREVDHTVLSSIGSAVGAKLVRAVNFG